MEKPLDIWISVPGQGVLWRAASDSMGLGSAGVSPAVFGVLAEKTRRLSSLPVDEALEVPAASRILAKGFGNWDSGS